MLQDNPDELEYASYLSEWDAEHLAKKQDSFNEKVNIKHKN